LTANTTDAPADPAARADPKRAARARRRGLLRRLKKLRWVFVVAVTGLAAWAAYQHRSDFTSAGRAVARVSPAWLAAAIVAQVASLVVFARLQRWLLRMGGIRVGVVPMAEIVLAGNAMSMSLPGGAAWSATWAFGQLRRRGANRVLAGWVILVAGALASFAIFIIVVAGAWIAGASGPVADLRAVAAVLAAVPLLVAAGLTAASRSEAVRGFLGRTWEALSARARPARAIGRVVQSTADKLRAVRPGALGWTEALGMAMANWLLDAACLVLCIKALHFAVPWRGILVIYGLTQISASLPITPGGLGVVEGSLTALLVAYGTKTSAAFAIVLIYRLVSFWGLVPVGWAAWFLLELAGRRGLRRRPHPWAIHLHGGGDYDLRSVGPERVLPAGPCAACSEDAPAPEVDRVGAGNR
jgi:uncharacterized membrane protein YbhN (UPF0104 family)